MAQEARAIPTRSYKLEVKIGDRDFTADLLSARVISSIVVPYQIVVLDLFVFRGHGDLIKDRILEENPIKLTVKLLGIQGGSREGEGVPLQQVDFELMYLKSYHAVSPTAMTPNTVQKDRTIMSLACLCRKPFKTVTTLVNDVFTNTTLEKVIKSLVGTTEATLRLDTSGINQNVIDQVVIPPLTLHRAIQYIDSTFGLYDGACEVHCRYDNTLFISNMSRKVAKAQRFTIYQLPLDLDKKELENKLHEVEDGNSFITYAPIKNQFSGNAKATLLARKLEHIVKPKDKLYYKLEHNLDDLCSDVGILYKTNKIYTDRTIDRTRYYIDQTGYEDDETFIKSKVGKHLTSLSTTTVHIERNFRVLSLLDVGECVKLASLNPDYIDLAGKYILKSSEIRFQKRGDWIAVATLDLARSNNIV